eukprot:CAMPEP_0185725264 /NCGR_PEP_ID=MMETSP1171-20130828/1561_1 /TAXON_ID=374046 /ORGANISM="Helicotheca tamensis, Strain CCMP826" /LENGTH=44 /DNA_ID= /DNA_START= /DNA_END= /DNA_ORIENTATION=
MTSTRSQRKRAVEETSSTDLDPFAQDNSSYSFIPPASRTSRPPS